MKGRIHEARQPAARSHADSPGDRHPAGRHSDGPVPVAVQVAPQVGSIGLYNSRAQQIITCNEKLRHLSKAAAEFWIDQRGDNHRLKKPPVLAAYRCDVCAGWHITSHAHDR